MCIRMCSSLYSAGGLAQIVEREKRVTLDFVRVHKVQIALRRTRGHASLDPRYSERSTCRMRSEVGYIIQQQSGCVLRAQLPERNQVNSIVSWPFLAEGWIRLEGSAVDKRSNRTGNNNIRRTTQM